jgi:hypothetical protein
MFCIITNCHISLGYAGYRTIAAKTARNTEMDKEMIYKCSVNNDLAYKLSFFPGCEKNLLVFDIGDEVLYPILYVGLSCLALSVWKSYRNHKFRM